MAVFLTAGSKRRSGVRLLLTHLPAQLTNERAPKLQWIELKKIP